MHRSASPALRLIGSDLDSSSPSDGEGGGTVTRLPWSQCYADLCPRGTKERLESGVIFKGTNDDKSSEVYS